MIYYITAITTFISAVLGTAFSVQAVRKGENTERTNALYLFARSMTLTLFAFVLLLGNFPKLLILITGGMLLVQLIDGMIGIYIKNFQRTAGPLTMALIHGICLWFLLK